MRIIIEIEERDEAFDSDKVLEAVKGGVTVVLFPLTEAKNWEVYEEKDSE